MTRKVAALRNRLVSRPCALVESAQGRPRAVDGRFHCPHPESAIEAADRAIEEESSTPSGRVVPRPALSAESR
jgi:hypothetical protein